VIQDGIEVQPIEGEFLHPMNHSEAGVDLAQVVFAQLVESFLRKCYISGGVFFFWVAAELRRQDLVPPESSQDEKIGPKSQTIGDNVLA
jgi:hypothetical protein